MRAVVEQCPASPTRWAQPAKLGVRAVLILAALASSIVAGCGDGTGVCTACCGPSGQTYCKDGWTEDECKDWSSQKVNGLSWNFYEGQTCAERGWESSAPGPPSNNLTSSLHGPVSSSAERSTTAFLAGTV